MRTNDSPAASAAAPGQHPGAGSSALKTAAAKTKRVKRQLVVASAELLLTTEVLTKTLPKNAKDEAEVARALEQNLEVEEKLQHAAEELHVVTELLKDEQAHSDSLEKQLAAQKKA